MQMREGVAVANEARGRVDRFLNRLLGLSVRDQALLFTYFNDTYNSTVAASKSGGTFDDGIVVLRAESIKLMMPPQALHMDPHSGALTNILTLCVDRGVAFIHALAQHLVFQAQPMLSLPNAQDDHSGFYIANFSQGRCSDLGRPLVLLALSLQKVHRRSQRKMLVLRPNNGNAAPMWLNDLMKNYRKVDIEEAKHIWEGWYQDLESKNYPRRNYGTRKSKVCLIVGAVLPVWRHLCMCFSNQEAFQSGPLTVEGAANGFKRRPRRMRVVRAALDSGEKVIGLEVKEDMVSQLLKMCENSLPSILWRH